MEIKKGYKILFFIIILILFILSIPLRDLAFIRYGLGIILLIIMGMFCFKRPTLKPIYISFVIGIIVLVIFNIIALQYFDMTEFIEGPQNVAADLYGLLSAITYLLIGSNIILLFTLIGLVISYIKTKNKVVLIFLIIIIILFLILLTILIYDIRYIMYYRQFRLNQYS